MRRTITRIAIITAALCSIVLISFPSLSSTLGAVYKPQVVHRTSKGDRLSNVSSPPKPSLERAAKRVPVGCDRAFSSMSGPQFSTLFGRCVV
jgi:hypothetical protein